LETSEALVENERALRMLADAVPQIICTAGPDGKVDYFNRRWFEFTGLSEDQTFEKDGWLKAFHPEDRSAVVAGWGEAARDGSDFSVEARLRSQTGEYRWFLERAVALRTEDGSVIRLFATATDINETKLVEEREKFLSHVSEVLGSTLDPGDLLQKITELCVPAFADWCQVQSLTADNELVVEAVRHRDPTLNARMKGLVGRPVVFIHDTSLGSPHVLHKAHSAVLDHEATLRAVHENVLEPEDRAIYEEAGLGTCLIVPLIFRGQTRGTLHLVSVDPASRRPEITLDIAEELAHRAALAIDNSRQYEREHRVAMALQHALLPTRLPSHPRIDLSYAYRPAERESRIGGDWYDAFAISEGRVAISIGDVAGHGLEASVAMNEARQALRLSALEGLSPAQTLRRANAALMLDPEHPLITAIYGVIDVDRSTFRYSCAGHPPPALVPLCGRARYLEGGGIPLGVEQDVSFPAREVTLKSYATLLLYTDGLIEFDRNLERESLRLLAALSERVHDTSADGAGALLRHVLNNRQLDDIAVLAATILPAQAEPVEMKLPAVPASATIARRFVSRFARVVALDADRSFDLALAVGEAVANAIEHAYKEAPGDFMLRLSSRDDAIFGEVQDLGSWREPSPNSDRGRGLEILAAITQRFEVSRGAAGTTVAFSL
jgi:PAS domain S-box-containing protein